MSGLRAFWEKPVLKGICALVVALFVLSACGSTTTGTGGSTPSSGSCSGQSQTPINIGISLSLSGDFSADGKAFQQGYQLWASDVNKAGGLLCRQVHLDILSDASSTTQVVTNYQTLINTNHDDLVLGPYSTLLTKPASVVAARYGYAFIEGAGGGPSVFTQGLHNIFDVSPPIKFQMDGFVQYIQSLPNKPTTIAYATEDDPFTQPMVDQARSLFESAGFKTASYQLYSAETTDFTPIAQKIIAAKAQVVVLGSMLNDVIAEVQAFRQQHYNPEAIIASAGPDQGSSFSGPIGGANVAEGIMFPNGWYPGLTSTYQNKQMVSEYLAKYGGTAADISADVAEAYSVGQVLTEAVNKIHSIDNTKLIAELHSGDTFQDVQGLVKFDNVGENTAGVVDLFQWQKGNVVAVYPPDQATTPPEFPKPNWP
jgi:branched-chain amino acid transport system substrate-binding protein